MLLVVVTAKEMEACPGEDLPALDKHPQTKHWYQTLHGGVFNSLFFNAVTKDVFSRHPLV